MSHPPKSKRLQLPTVVGGDRSVSCVLWANGIACAPRPRSTMTGHFASLCAQMAAESSKRNAEIAQKNPMLRSSPHYRCDWELHYGNKESTPPSRQEKSPASTDEATRARKAASRQRKAKSVPRTDDSEVIAVDKAPPLASNQNAPPLLESGQLKQSEAAPQCERCGHGFCGVEHCTRSGHWAFNWHHCGTGTCCQCNKW